MGAKALYICYFGVTEPLVQTQVLPYLRELVKAGHKLTLLTFEPAESAAELKNGRQSSIKDQLLSEGIDWHWRKYHKRLSVLATAYDVVAGTLFVRQTVKRHDIEILHGRVHVPTLMGALGRKLSGKRPKLLFDIRGFFPEEYTDAGVWPADGWLYRLAKRVEGWLLRESDGFVVLTERARDILFSESRSSGSDKLGRPVEVIPCCVDLERFSTPAATDRVGARRRLGVEDKFVVTYVGSFGGWYMTDEMVELFSALRRRRADTFALIVTQRGQAEIAARLRQAGFTDGEFLVTGAAPGEVPQYLAAADVAISFIKACYSKQSSSPTKIAEYLAAGLPIIANEGVGDIDTLIRGERVGVIVKRFSERDYILAADGIEQLGDIRKACRQVAESYFDLQKVGGTRYRAIYSRLLPSRALRSDRHGTS